MPAHHLPSLASLRARRRQAVPVAVVAAIVATAALVVFLLAQSGATLTGPNVPVSVAAGGVAGRGAPSPSAVVIIGGQGTGSAEPVSFVPVSLTIHAGQTVKWIWQDHSVPQNVTFADGVHSATQTSGSFFRTFAVPGRYAYASTVHFDMNGVVSVEP